MPGSLAVGQRVKTIYSKTSDGRPLDCIVEAFIGKGGQGEVYKVNLLGMPVALKWYLADTLKNDVTLRHRLDAAIRNGLPKHNRDFMWPFDLVEAQPGSGFGGYVMPLIPERFKEFNELLAAQVAPSSRVLATIGFHLAEDLLQLHGDGFCYIDLNFRNVQCDFETGDVVILDDDNVTINGASSAIMSPPKFRAPELFRGSAPNIQTDLYSLAILLFYLLLIHHPLEGKKVFKVKAGEAADRELYCDHPVFIFDPHDRSNELDDPDYYRNPLGYWAIYPQFMRDLFIKAFTAGLQDPDARVTEDAWRHAMCRLRDSIVRCPHCTAENFYNGDVPLVCWNRECGRPLGLPPRLRIGSGVQNIIILEPNTQLFAHHLTRRRFDFSLALAEVVTAPLALRNLSRTRWVVLSDGREETILPGESLVLKDKARINFGEVTAAIRM